VALAVVVAGARAYPHDALHIAALVAISAVALWLAHVYAHGLGHAVAHDEHLALAELRHIARREASIIEAALPPVVALILGGVGLLSTRASVWTALGAGLAVLAAQGFRFARIEGLGLVGTVLVVAANLGFGAVLIAVKLAITH
jgi:hypothetical protein